LKEKEETPLIRIYGGQITGPDAYRVRPTCHKKMCKRPGWGNEPSTTHLIPPFGKPTHQLY